MKEKISPSLLLPLLYGLLAAWLVIILCDVVVLLKVGGMAALSLLLASSLLVFLTAMPCLRRAAWAYSNVRKYHNAEYFYNLGNGQGNAKALAYFEKKVKLAATVWLRRQTKIAVFAYLFVVLASGNWLKSLWVVAAVAAIVIAIEVGLWTMLFSARKLCYDKYGNIKSK